MRDLTELSVKWRKDAYELRRGSDPAQIWNDTLYRCADELEATLSRAGAEAVELCGYPKEICLEQGPDDMPVLSLRGMTLCRFPRGSWAQVTDALAGFAPPAAAGVPDADLRALYDAASNGFHISETCGPDGKYHHVIKFRSMDLLHAYEDAWIKVMLAIRDFAPQPTEPVTIADIQPPAIDDPKVLETMEYGDAALASA